MPNRLTSVAILMLAVNLLVVATAAADSRRPAWRPGNPVHERGYYLADNRINLDSAVSRIRQQTGGRVLSADTVRGDGRTVHEIKVLTDQGHVRRWRVDGDTGEVIRRRQQR